MTTKSLRNLFVKNAFANILGGAGSALFNLLLPALVVRHLGKLEFSVWSLALQVLIYLQIFGFGLQTAMTRFIAHGHELNDLADQRKTVKAGLVLATSFVALAAMAVVLLVLFYPLLFSGVPAGMVNEFRICIALLGLSAAWQLFALIPMGLFMGLHRNIIPVGGQLFIRMLSLLVLWIVLKEGAGLLTLSIALAACGALIVPINFLAIRHWTANYTNKLGTLDKHRFRELLNYCGSLAIWNVAMLFVTGINIVVVGYYDFEKVAAYSLAATAITILVGVLQALLNPLVAIGSSIYANKEKHQKLPRLLTISSAYCSGFLLLITLFFFIFGKYILDLWISKEYVNDVLLILTVLLIAHTIRSFLMAYSVLLVATSEHKKAILPAIAEGAANLFFSIIFAMKWGAIGVAYGVLIGSATGVLVSAIFVVNRTKSLASSRLSFFYNVLALPLIGLLVLIIFKINYDTN